MHEAGIAASILEIVETEALKHGARAIGRVRVRVGEFSGVVPEALEFAFDALKDGTIASGATLDMERIPLVAWCPRCRQNARPETNLVLWCPSCEGPLEITAGQELDVAYIDLEEGEPGWNESPSSKRS